MTEITQEQLEADPYRPFNALRLDLPGYTARFWTGIGPLTLLGQEFVGSGRVIEIGGIEGSLDTTSSTMRLGFSALPMQPGEANDIIAELIEYLVKGSLVRRWFGLLDEDRNVIADPDLVFIGHMDAPAFQFGDGATVRVDAIGAMEFAMRQETGRWNPAGHEAIWPGDIFFEFTGRAAQPFQGRPAAPSQTPQQFTPEQAQAAGWPYYPF